MSLAVEHLAGQSHPITVIATGNATISDLYTETSTLDVAW